MRIKIKPVRRPAGFRPERLRVARIVPLRAAAPIVPQSPVDSSPVAPFNAVYHIAAMNHWRVVVREQLTILFSGGGCASLNITLAGSDSDEQVLGDILASLARPEPVQIKRSRLDDFEHSAMTLVDEAATASEFPVLYFHTKGCGFPHEWSELWRKYMNVLIAQAGKCAGFLRENDYDACGYLLTRFPETNPFAERGHSIFGGNFWMARACYIRGLVPYAEWYEGTEQSRYVAERGLDREKRIRAIALDGTHFNIADRPSFVRFMCQKRPDLCKLRP
jgi:hypothetical protein